MQTLGWDSAHKARASRSSLDRAWSDAASSGRTNLSATARPRVSSRALNTSPMPPAPRRSTSVNRPAMRAPGRRADSASRSIGPVTRLVSRNEPVSSSLAHSERTSSASSGVRSPSSDLRASGDCCLPRSNTASIESQFMTSRAATAVAHPPCDQPQPEDSGNGARVSTAMADARSRTAPAAARW